MKALNGKKLTIVLSILLLIIVAVRAASIQSLKVSLGLDSVYLQIVDVFSKYKKPSMPPAFNATIDVPLSLEGKCRIEDSKHLNSYFCLFTGKIKLLETDFHILPVEDNSPNPLSFTRVYNSFYSSQKTSLGYGWRPIWEVYFSLVNDIYVFQGPDGEITTFKYFPKENDFAVLTGASMPYQLKFKTEENTFHITSEYGITYVFPQIENGQNYVLSRLQDKNGIRYTINRNPSDNSVRSLCQEPSGREVGFFYDAEKKVISSIQFPSGVKLHLEYDSLLNLIKVKNNQDNYLKTYEYAHPFHPHLVTGEGENFIYRNFHYEGVKLTKITLPENGIFQINRDEILGICEIIFSNKTSYKFYNSGDHTMRMEGPHQFHQKILFDDKGNILKVTDSQNASVEYTWSKAIQLIQKQSRVQGVDIFDYDEQQNLVRYTDATGNTTRFQYSQDNLLIRKITPKGDAFKFTYKGKLLESVLIEKEKIKTSYLYDESANIIASDDEKGDRTYYRYNHDGYPIEKNSADGSTEVYEWKGSCLSSIYLKGLDGTKEKISQFDYGKSGKLLAHTDKSGNKTSFEYDKLGRIHVIRNPNGNVERFAWTEEGLLKKYEDERAQKWEFNYDALNRVSEITANQQSTWKFDYDPAKGIQILPRSSSFSSLTTPDGFKTILSYDKNYRVKEIIWPNGITENFEYDLCDNLTSKTRNQNENISYFYDRNNFLEYVYSKNSEEVIILKHDWRGNLKSLTTPESVTYLLDHDAAGNPVSLHLPFSPALAEWKWDSQGRIISVRNSNSGKTFHYNSDNNLSAVHDTQKGLQEYFFDTTGHLTSRTDSEGREINYSYYDNNLLKTKTLVNSQIAYQWYYDINGKPKQVSGVSPYSLTWEDANLTRLTFDKKNILLMSYTPGGKIQKKTYPSSYIQQNKYDENGRLQNISVNGIDTIFFQYDSFGRLETIEYPNKLKTTYERDQNNRIINILTTDENNRTLFKRSYTYKNGIPIQIVTERVSIERKYNEKGLLEEETIDDHLKTNIEYSYENSLIRTAKVKNLKEEYSLEYVYYPKTNLLKKIRYQNKKIPEEPLRVDLYGAVKKDIGFLEVNKQVVQVSGNKFKISNLTLEPGENNIDVQSVSDKQFNIQFAYDPLAFKTFRFDKTGKLNFYGAQGDHYVYDYNDQGQLTKFIFSLGLKMKKINYSYYGNGVLYQKQTEVENDPSNTSGRFYLFDEKELIIGEFPLDNSGYQHLYMYTPEGQIIFRIDRGQQKFFYHLDIDGSVIGITDAKGNVVASYSYDAFGKVIHEEQSIHNPFLYLGHFFDKDSRFYFHKDFSGTEEEHAIFFEKSTNLFHSSLNTPEKMISYLFPPYASIYPSIPDPNEILKTKVSGIPETFFNSLNPDTVKPDAYENFIEIPRKKNLKKAVKEKSHPLLQ